MKQIELLNLFNRGSDRLSSGLDLTNLGWGWVADGWRMGVLDGIKAILSPVGAWAWAELGNMKYSSNVGRLIKINKKNLHIRALSIVCCQISSLKHFFVGTLSTL